MKLKKRGNMSLNNRKKINRSSKIHNKRNEEQASEPVEQKNKSEERPKTPNNLKNGGAPQSNDSSARKPKKKYPTYNKKSNNQKTHTNKAHNNDNTKDTKQNKPQEQVRTSPHPKKRKYKGPKKHYYNSNREKSTTKKPTEKKVYEICPVCNKEITVPSTSIIEKESQKKAHFDCVLNQIKETVTIEENEKLYYLGGGAFGVVREWKSKNRTRFLIRKRFQYENKDKEKETQPAG